MFQTWDYQCKSEDCGHEWEGFVQSQDKDGQTCPECGHEARRLLAPTAGWVCSAERTAAMGKKRSQDHLARCKKTGQSVNDTANNSASNDPVWRNKTRAKNTKRSTMDQFANVHKSWNPGKQEF